MAGSFTYFRVKFGIGSLWYHFFHRAGPREKRREKRGGGGGAERRLPKPEPCGLLVSPSGHVMGPGVRWGDFAARKSLRGPRRISWFRCKKHGRFFE